MILQGIPGDLDLEVMEQKTPIIDTGKLIVKDQL